MEEITDTTAQVSWTEGSDNHSPITSYSVQARTPFSVGWQAARTGEGEGPVPWEPVRGLPGSTEPRRL